MKVIVYPQWKKGKSLGQKGKYLRFEGDLNGDEDRLDLMGTPHNISLFGPRLISVSADGMRIEGKEEAELDSGGRRLYYHQEWWIIPDVGDRPIG